MTEAKRPVGRPSKRPQRIDEVLDAFTRCVARHGLAGTTLQKVADEAGMARGHLRHYAGNRDELRELFARRIIGRYAERAAQLATTGTPGTQTRTLIDYLFGEEMEPGDDNAAIDALLAAARFDDDLRERIRTVYAGLETSLMHALAADHPGRPETAYTQSAYQILALAYGHWTLREMGFPQDRTAGAHRLAIAVMTSLSTTAAERSSPSAT